MLSQRHIQVVGERSLLDPLLAATRDSILDVGLRRTTLADVARRAGVSRMTAYRQYGDLDALVSALLTDELVAAVEDVSRQVAGYPTARARLVEAAVLLVPRIAAHPLYRRILALDPELLMPLVVDRFGSTQQAVGAVIAAQIRAGRRDGSIRRGASADLVSVHLLVALQSFVFSARVLAATHPAAATGRELRALVDGYLAPDRP